MSRAWLAGVEDGHRFAAWSAHATESAAKRAAVRYARQQRQTTGGVYAWAGGVRGPSGALRWYDSDGVECTGGVRAAEVAS